MDKITYSIIEKNKKVVKIPKLYGRIRAGKRERLVPLGRNMEEAQKWLKRAQRAYEEACDLETEGKPIPPELLARVLTVDTDIRVASVSSAPAEKAGGTLELWAQPTGWPRILPAYPFRGGGEGEGLRGIKNHGHTSVFRSAFSLDVRLTGHKSSHSIYARVSYLRANR